MKMLNKIVVLLVVVAICSSCGFSKLAEQIEVKGLTNFELKGMTGLMVDAIVVNDSRYNIEMSEADVTFYLDSKKMVRLEQVGEALSPAESRSEVSMLWRLSGVDPRAISSFVSLLTKDNYDDITISYTTRFSTKGLSKRISQENVELTKFMAIFARDTK